MLADWIEGKRRDKFGEDQDLIVMGDFNIPSLDDAMFEAVTKHGLQISRRFAASRTARTSRGTSVTTRFSIIPITRRTSPTPRHPRPLSTRTISKSCSRKA